jgi:hypothetical protein
MWQQNKTEMDKILVERPGQITVANMSYLKKTCLLHIHKNLNIFHFNSPSGKGLQENEINVT